MHYSYSCEWRRLVGEPVRRKTVTLFNRHGDNWYPTTFENVYFNTDRAKVVAMYGENSADRAILHVWFRHGGEGGKDAVAANKTYLQPMQFKEVEDPENYFTFAAGEKFDFFIEGEWHGAQVIKDNLYGINGFYDYMNRRNDLVYAVTSCTRYDMLAHFEVTGK